MSVSFEEAKAYMQKCSGENPSLYEVLSNIVLKIMMEKPEDPLKVFERLVIAEKNKSKLQKEGEESNIKAKEGLLEWANTTSNLYKELSEEETEGVDPQPVQKLSEESYYLEWAGVGLSREDTFRLELSMKRLAATKPVTGLRFWGKILARANDYIILEGQTDREPKEEDEGKVENPGEGSNILCYYVCTKIGGEWTLLPDVTPEQIVIARKLRRFMTGDLEAPVPGYPPFPGVEKHFLRAQIARISAETTIAPKNMFIRPDEEGFEIALNEDLEENPIATELKQLGSWTHCVLPLNSIGRCLPIPAPEDEEGEPILGVEGTEAPNMLLELGPERNDWAVRVHPAGSSHSILSVRSLKWPGAVTVSFGPRIASLYVGDAIEHSDAPYAPTPLPSLASEFDATKLKMQELVLEDPALKEEEDDE
eukprot:TRINITY_DN777967_c0_g1_i1.p1 TRINITY_DN777967_c0_g1~~TRINITY_DN777967_c0_g1_i1.p1  ORF type:complete len:423 (+),score=160.52 TRINITY_DN777967_c0_g1_i1:156-1424(+)